MRFRFGAIFLRVPVPLRVAMLYCEILKRLSESVIDIDLFNYLLFQFKF